MSTGGAATNAIMNTETAVNKVGIMITPNQPMYKRFSVEVTHSQKRAHKDEASRRSKIAVILFIVFLKIKNFPKHFYACYNIL